ncbi:tetratricopeptide repeat protein [Bradyrhizobium sp.]|jgi:tetratricopeptide (TPR) repeat protein|uniref:tetratricopeptide repeat protein n=1 Tax=Bradyrhizobium sp. TaxID=376 RepID=UPI002DDCB6ED|nr:tetratricopeptide repeat protein [Bradyrhizobium sp.]HEV2159693.1 tetratricopeptide repeat protein [Bradyrhizobium sp.]
MFGMTGRALVGAAAGVGVLALTVLLEISNARAEMPLSAKCNAVGNFSVDDRIAGCTALIEAAPAMQQGLVMAHMRRAMFYRQKGEIDREIADYDQIIERYPDNLPARLHRAFAHLRQREPAAAMSDYTKIIELDPRNTYAYIGRAQIYLARLDFVRAIADYDQALLIHPDNVIAHVDRGLAYVRKGDPDRAMADCDRAVELSPQTGGGQLCRGRVYFAKGNRERALAELDQTMPIKPRNDSFYYFRAESFSQLGEFDRAIADYDRIVELNPRSRYVYGCRGVAYAQKGDYDRAIADYNEAIRLAHQDQGNAGDRQSQIQGQDADPISASVAGESIVLASGDGPVLRARGTAYYAKGDFDRAIADYDEAIRFDPRDKDSLGLRANAYKAKGDFSRSIADYDQLVQLDPRDVRAYRARASAHWQAGSLAKSLADLDEAVRLDPKNAYAALWREIIARRSHEPDRLAEAATQLDMTKWPAPIINLFLGTTTPEQVLDAANDPDPRRRKGQVCEAHFYAGELTLQRGSREEASRLFDLAVADCPKTFVEKQAADFELSSLRASR